MLPRHFLTDESQLSGDDAVAALITVEDGRYLMQLRDDKPGIFYPGHWGCFGGAVTPGETPLACIKRELSEELGFEPEACSEFVRFDFDLSRVGSQRKLYRIYFETRATQSAVAHFTLTEGAAMGLLTPAEILDRVNLAPYDSFAIWLHMAKARFR